MSWIRLCVRFKNGPLRCIMFHSTGTDETSGFVDTVDYENKLVFYGSLQGSHSSLSKFCYSYKQGSDGKLYMDFYKADTCSPGGETFITEGGFGGYIYLYNSKPNEELNTMEYKYYQATDSRTGIKRYMIMPHWRTAWINGEWSYVGSFWAQNYDRSDDNKFIICGRKCVRMREVNPLFQLDKHTYCKNNGSSATSDGNNVWNRKYFDWDCNGALIHQERVKGPPNHNDNGDDNYFKDRYSKDTDPDNKVDGYITPKNGGFGGLEVIPVINIFRNNTGGADDIWGLYKELNDNERYMLCKRADKGNNIPTHSNSIQYMKYSARDIYDEIKNKYDPKSETCKNILLDYSKRTWGIAGSDGFNICKNKETDSNCESVIREYCLKDKNVMQPVCQETIKNLISRNSDRRPRLLKDLRNKYLDIKLSENKDIPVDKTFRTFCEADDTALVSVSNVDTEFKKKCDDIYSAFCKRNASSLNKTIKDMCSCVNGKTIGDKLIPFCHDKTCIGSGYKTSSMITFNQCPKCVNIQEIKNIASDAQISNIKQDMICNVTENTSETTTADKDKTETGLGDLTKEMEEAKKKLEEEQMDSENSGEENSDEENTSDEKKDYTNYIYGGAFLLVVLIIVYMLMSSSRRRANARRRRSKR